MIIRVLEDEPVLDGTAHPGERILVDSLDKDGMAAAAAVSDFFAQFLSQPQISAGLLRLVARLERYRLEPWATTMVIRAMEQSSILLREAAVTAIENWEARDLAASVLLRHREPVRWLKSYIESVITDLGLKKP
jgi:hypothetical protein